MKISEKYKRFNSRVMHLLVAAKQEAVVYKCENDSISIVNTLKVPKPHYSDNEGMFMRSGRGNNYESGSVLKYNQNIEKKMVSDFHKNISEIIKEVSPLSELYIFAPQYLLQGVIKALPKPISEKIKSKFPGNYYQKHPFDLLDKIVLLEDGKVVQLKNEEAESILRKGKHK